MVNAAPAFAPRRPQSPQNRGRGILTSREEDLFLGVRLVNWSTLLHVAGGVGLFLYGIKLMSEALQFIAGDRMRHLIGTLTKTPLRGIFVGILVTILIQSSSGTTVMTVSFVNAGLMTLKQAIGIIMGANIGTTITAQIIAFSIQDMALPFVAAGVAMAIFGRTKKLRYFGNGVVGLGLLFMGMQTMEAATSFMASRGDLLLSLSRSPILGVAAGALITMIVQSSAATIGLTMAMASQGLIGIDAAIPIILGDNIGTTITAVLAAIGTSRSAKQAAAAHVLFNFLGVVIFLLFLPFYRALVLRSASDVGRQIANAHTIFNVVNTFLFFPFVSVFAASATAAVEAVKDELLRMGDIAQGMLAIARSAYVPGARVAELNEEFASQEKEVNAINRAVASYASEIWQKGVSADISTVLGCYVNAAADLERIGDHVENLMELAEPLNGCLSKSALTEFGSMLDTADLALSTALSSIKNEDASQADHVINDLENRIDDQERQYRKNHIERLNRGLCDPEKGVNFIDLLGNLERIGDHSHNIAYYTHDIVKLSAAPVHPAQYAGSTLS